jgi:exopolyphosphatase / guanosine-5'-triphosphate,3'-diphosphate pyrophosphatase
VSLGTMRIKGRHDLFETVQDALSSHPQFEYQRGKSVYLVGGAWRAMGKFAQHINGYPLAILANFSLPPQMLDRIKDESADLEALKALKLVPQPRAETLHDATRLAQALVKVFEPTTLITSAQGIREGLLFGKLSASERAEDPLVACARFEGLRLARSAFDGDLMNDWIAQLFSDESAALARIRHTACLIADTAWQIHPDHRADHARDTALNGNWPGVDGRDRIVLARTLYAAHGGKDGNWPDHPLLSDDKGARAARIWGLAIRLAMRIDGGTMKILAKARLETNKNEVLLHIPAEIQCDAITRRLKSLAQALEKEGKVKAI